ncbi:MAG: endolytic transglycosylase MltG [Bacteroidota bacterium]|nr:endolytic transglycosylase MltG [Bacteroidota bacterium]
MKNPGKIIGAAFLLVLVFALYAGWELFGPTLTPPIGNFFYIQTGSTYGEVRDSLVKKGIIQSAFWFDRTAHMVHYEKEIRPGKYRITDGMSLLNLVRMLRSGRQVPVRLVITKLRTKEELAHKIGVEFEPDSADVIRYFSNNDSLAPFGVDSNTVLTLIIPNTYIINWNTSLTAILKRLARENHRFWNPKRLEEAAKLHLTPQQVYTLASIVEEETNRVEDKGKIASVYLNRLHKGMKLAADPTIKYAMKDFGLKRIYYKYLTVPSPYNTYLHKGLPPGPINTPSMETLDAVLNSPQTDYLYFVARPNSGGLSDFSKTFGEHQHYARAYQNALDSLYKPGR